MPLLSNSHSYLQKKTEETFFNKLFHTWKNIKKKFKLIFRDLIRRR